MRDYDVIHSVGLPTNYVSKMGQFITSIDIKKQRLGVQVTVFYSNGEYDKLFTSEAVGERIARALSNTEFVPREVRYIQ